MELMKYPTKKQILSKEITFKKEVIELLLKFKIKWNRKDRNKRELLVLLVNDLGVIYKKPALITLEDDKPCQYEVLTQTININKSLSIISTLHEFAHHLLGSSELNACRWSIWLFMKTFPESYKELKWKGHLLIKK